MKASPLSQAGLDRLHRAMAARVAKGELPGMVSLIARGDEVDVDAMGTMAFGRTRPMRRDTIFRIVSLTKPILATATMMQVEDGTLALNEPIDRLLPELADRRVLRHIDGPLDDTVAANRPITVEDLLTFRMGYGMLIQPTFDPPFPIVQAANELQLVIGAGGPANPARSRPVDRALRDAAADVSARGAVAVQYRLARTGRTGRARRRRAAGGVLEDAHLRAMGMKDTGFFMPPEQTDRLPSQYVTDFQTDRVELQTLTGPDVWIRPPAFPSGAGGLLSTVDDYMVFARMLLNKGIHRDERLLSLLRDVEDGYITAEAARTVYGQDT